MEELPGSCIMTEAYRIMTHMILQTESGTKVAVGPSSPLSPLGGIRDAGGGSPAPLPPPRPPPGGDEAACLASLLWLVAEQGQRHSDRPAPPRAWMRAATGRLALGLDQLHDLPARARPLLQLLVQPGGALHKVWRRSQGEEQQGDRGQGRGRMAGGGGPMQVALFPHFAATFLVDFYSALGQYFERQERYERAPSERYERAPSERYRPSPPSAAPRNANDRGNSRLVPAAPNRPDERLGSGSSGPSPPPRPPPSQGAVSRLAGNRLRDLCRGLELLPLMMQVGGGRAQPLGQKVMGGSAGGVSAQMADTHP